MVAGGRRAALTAILGLCAAVAGCGGESNTARLDLTVNVDPLLQLESAVVVVSGGGRGSLPRTFPLTAAAGDASAGSDAAASSDGGANGGRVTLRWQVLINKVTTPFVATIEATGKQGGADVVAMTADATISPGANVAATLWLSAACKDVRCEGSKTCVEGACVDRPMFPRRGDASVDAGVDSARDGGQDGASDRGPSEVGGDGGAANGAACTGGDGCESGHCVEGVCCDGACAGVCNSCRNALTSSLPDGMCGAVASGKDDPAARCDAMGAMTCGTTGRCDGKGACEKFGGTTTCRAAACSGGSFTAAATCDGVGNCPAAMSQDCKGALCTATAGCATACNADGECPNGYCTAARTCAAKKIDGASCAGANECAHGNCVGGVCCETACTANCNSCAMAETTQASGLCRPVKVGGPSGGDCAAETSACGRDGTCDGAGGCRVRAAGTSCGAAACVSAALTAAPACNGTGMCVTPPNTTPCPSALTCASSTACRTSCTADTDCVAGNYCASGACTPTKAAGAACAAAGQCTSGNCRDGVCCPASCTAACQGCAMSVTGSADGTCAGRTNNPPTSQLCGGECVNTTTSAANCGGCGHGCLGGTCVGGACQPVSLCQLPRMDVGTVGVNNTTVFIGAGTYDGASGTLTGGQIYSVPKGGGTPVSLVTLAAAEVAKFLPTETVLVWQELGGNRGGPFGKISSCTLGNCFASAAPLVNTLSGMAGQMTFEASSGKYFWQVNGSVNYSTLSPWLPKTFTPDLVLPQNLTNAGGFLYGSGYFPSGTPTYQLYRAPSAGGARTQLATSVAYDLAYAVGNFVYVLHDASGGQRLGRVPLPAGVGAAAPPDFPGTLAFPSGTTITLFADSTGLYWLDGTNLNMCPLSGCAGAPKVLAAVPDPNRELVTDGTAFFYKVSAGGVTRIMKLAR